MTTGRTRLPPGPRARWPLAHAFAFRRDPLAFLARLAREHGDVASLRLGPQRFYVLSHPDHVRDVLVTRADRFAGLAFEAVKRMIGDGVLSAQGEAHRRQRRLVQPAFHRQRLAAYGDVMAAHARAWRDARHDGEVVAVRDEMMRLTLAIVGETMFGAADATAADDVHALIAAGLALFGPFTAPVARWVEYLPAPTPRRFVRARRRLDARVYAMLAARRTAGGDRGDLLSMLLLAQEADDGALSDRQIRDEVMTVFLAGHETTASALTWAWWLLAQHPGAESRLHAEADALPGDASAADAARLPYAAAVFAETLRLYPTVPMVFRRALAEHDVDGYTIPAGAVVVLSQAVIQRDPRFWDDPDAFRPERWLTDAGDGGVRPRHAYFPFGGGTRVCIGEHFARLEGALVLATVARRWRLAALPEGLPPVDRATATRPPDALRMRVEAGQ